MSRQKHPNTDFTQPDEVNELKRVTLEFVKKVEAIDNEIETLKTDRKEVIDEYSKLLDMRTLQAALRVMKIQSTVDHRDTFDLFIDTLKDPTQ